MAPSQQNTARPQIDAAAELSAAIYKGPEEFAKKAQSMGYNPSDITLIRDDDGQVKAAVLNKGGQSTVVFRGTQDVQDVKTDLNIAKQTISVNGTNVEVHKGFHNDLHGNKNAQGQDMMAQIQAAIPPGNSVTFTGHSLGGALANLAAAEYPGKSELVTFGAPRVGGPAFAAALEQKLGNDHITRVVAPGDPIPHTPPSIGRGGFEHAGNPQVMDKNGNLHEMAKEEPLKDLLHTAQAAIKNPRILKDVLELKSMAGKELTPEQQTHKARVVIDLVGALVENSKNNHSMGNSYLASMDGQGQGQNPSMSLLAGLAKATLGNVRLTESSPTGTPVASVSNGATPIQAGSGPATTTAPQR
jgi:hypothetical protein